MRGFLAPILLLSVGLAAKPFAVDKPERIPKGIRAVVLEARWVREAVIVPDVDDRANTLALAISDDLLRGKAIPSSDLRGRPCIDAGTFSYAGQTRNLALGQLRLAFAERRFLVFPPSEGKPGAIMYWLSPSAAGEQAHRFVGNAAILSDSAVAELETLGVPMGSSKVRPACDRDFSGGGG